MKSVPEIRFPGFTDLWELRKVGEFAVESCEKGHNGQEALKLTVKLHTKGVCKMEEKGQGSDNTQYYVRHAGQLIYGKQNFFNGAIGIVPQSLDGYESTKDVPTFDIDDNVCVEWFYQYIARPEIYKSQEVNCTGTGSKRFHVNAFFDMNIPIPLIEEQKKISDYFKAIDNLITLQEQRCQVLKRLKQCMLQKMFPKDGFDKPEIRFPGFTDSWEQRKFGDVGSVSMCKRIFKNETSDGGDIPFYKIGTFGGEPDAYISRELFEEYKKKFSYPNEGDILLSASGTIGRIVEYTGEDAYFQDSNIVWLSHDKSICNKFLKVLYPTVKWDGIEGSTIKRLYNDNFLKTQFMMPKIEEQERLGEYFEQLDHLITLQERKCKVLRELKKCMLQKMFV